jgi:hypothetical protein
VAKNSGRVTTLNTNDIPVVESSGNVFADLDLPNADELQMKAELTRQSTLQSHHGPWTLAGAGGNAAWSQAA